MTKSEESRILMRPTILLLGALLFAMPSHAKTAKQLKDTCTPADTINTASELRAMNCAGYIEAIADNISTTAVFENGKRLIAELKEQYTLGQLEDAFLLYINQHPELERHPACEVLFQAWSEHKMVNLVPQPDLK
jgi:hypothetical protein